MVPWWVVGARLLTKCLAVGPQLPSALSPFSFFLKSFIIKAFCFVFVERERERERERENLQSQYNRELLTSTLAFFPGQKTSEVSSVEHLWVSPGNKEAGLEVEGLGLPVKN
jgi:hypothetical protein